MGRIVNLACLQGNYGLVERALPWETWVFSISITQKLSEFKQALNTLSFNLVACPALLWARKQQKWQQTQTTNSQLSHFLSLFLYLE